MLACGLCREESLRDREEREEEEEMIKIFEVTEVRTYRALVKIEVPDDVMWGPADYEKAALGQTREMEFVESGTSCRESNVSVEEYDAGRVLNWNEWMQ